MCHLCEDDDPDVPSLFEHCVCVKCGNAVCYEADGSNGLSKPAPNWRKSLICEDCFDAEIAESARDDR